MSELLGCDEFTLKSLRFSLFPLQKLLFTLLFILLFLTMVLLIFICFHQGLACRGLGLSFCVRCESANEGPGRLSLVWDHIVATDLRPIFNPFKRVL